MKHTLSKAARKRISRAQKARWKIVRRSGQHSDSNPTLVSQLLKESAKFTKIAETLWKAARILKAA